MQYILRKCDWKCRPQWRPYCLDINVFNFSTSILGMFKGKKSYMAATDALVPRHQWIRWWPLKPFLISHWDKLHRATLEGRYGIQTVFRFIWNISTYQGLGYLASKWEDCGSHVDLINMSWWVAVLNMYASKQVLNESLSLIFHQQKTYSRQ